MHNTQAKTPIPVEFFPPKDEAAESKLWIALDQLKLINLSFASVTYGAGGILTFFN